MASTAASAAGASAAGAMPQVAKKVAEQAVRTAPWVFNMPTRAIANVLLNQENHMMDHMALFKEAEKSGLMRSRRHFKHCLRMLKDQKRVNVICKGPEKPGSAKRAFAVQLTRRGSTIYTKYSMMPLPRGDSDGQPGLKDALV